MSHGSQRALVLTANLETRIIGVHTMPTDLPNFQTTRAHTPLPKYLKTGFGLNGRDGWEELGPSGPLSYVLGSFNSVSFERPVANLVLDRAKASVSERMPCVLGVNRQ